MPNVTVSSKFQITIPREIRESMGLHAGDQLAVFQFDNRIEIVRVRPIREMRGVFNGMDTTIERDED